MSTFITDFFKNLVRSKVNGVQAEVKSKAKSYQAQAKGKAASKVNKVLDAPVNKARAKVADAEKAARAKASGKPLPKKDDAKKDEAPQRGGGGGRQEAAPEQKGGGGWFSSKKAAPDQAGGQRQQGGAPRSSREAPADFDPGMKTQAIDISGLVDDRAQDVVGWVVCLNGALRGKDFRLVTGKNMMGTAADCDIVLTDGYLSSKHAVIRHEEGRFMLVDLDSTNGTFVNDRRVSKTELIDNDKVRLGRTELKFKSLF
ncbi:MAG: FHA domain-containing protein [Myxococcales bacterium]|nr:FHA domain-containing protein [Myxococcales bacterium]